jgi:hypothetical protein
MTFEDICRISTASGDVGKTAIDRTWLAPSQHEETNNPYGVERQERKSRSLRMAVALKQGALCLFKPSKQHKTKRVIIPQIDLTTEI